MSQSMGVVESGNESPGRQVPWQAGSQAVGAGAGWARAVLQHVDGVEMAVPRFDLGSQSINPQCRTSSLSRQSGLSACHDVFVDACSTRVRGLPLA